MKFRSMLALVLAVLLLISAPAMAATEITIWHTFTEDQESALQGFAEAFNATQDDYVVLVQSQNYSGFLDAVYNAVANGVGPNIIIDYSVHGRRLCG